MKTLWKIVCRLMVWVFPVFLFDGCLNKDPFLWVDERFYIGAAWPGAPVYLNYTNGSLKRSEEVAPEKSDRERMKAYETFQKKRHWQLYDISQFSFSDKAIIGNSPKGWFIADRSSGELNLFPSANERDLVVRNVYHLDPLQSFGRPSCLMQLRSNFLWPWVHLYYAACLVLIPLLTARVAIVPPRKH